MEEVTEIAAAPRRDLSALLAQIARPPTRETSVAEGLAPGAVLADRFELVRELGRGGFGSVWEARDLLLHRAVAVKVLRRRGASAGHVEREAEAVARLAHPNIVAIHDAGLAGPSPFLVLELLRGETLEAVLARGPLAPARALAIAHEVARALAHAHAAGVVHRDLKPSNVFLADDGAVKVLDFGLAQLFGRPAPDGGTPGYMSPEQRRGGPEDERSDVYALGVVLREMVSGALPPGPGSAPRAPVAPGLEALLERLTAADPARRPRDGGAALAELQRAREAWLAQPARRLPRSALAALVAAIALAAAGHAPRAPPAAEPPPGERLAVVVADVVNETGDRDLDALSGLLITSLEQSRRLAVVTRARMADLARQLGHGAARRVDEALGRELARAAGARALLVATVHRFGDTYTLELQAVDLAREAYLFTVKASGGGRASLPDLVDRVGEEARRALRERDAEVAASRTRVGESVTASLEAYRHYFEARQLDASQFDAARALAAYRRALAADPGFALPHLELAILAAWHEAPEEDPEWHLAEAARRAPSLPEKERNLVLAWKASQEGRFDEARPLFRALAAAHPDDKEVLYLAGETLWHGGTPDGPAEAAALFRRALDLDPTYLVAMIHLLEWLGRDGRGGGEEALLRARRAVALGPGPMTIAMLARAHAYAGELDAAVAEARRAAELSAGGHFESSYVLAEVLHLAGRQAEAEAELRRWIGPQATAGQRRIALELLPVALAAEGRRREALRAFEALAGGECGRRCDAFDEVTKLHLLVSGGELGAAREELRRWEPPDARELAPHLWLWPWVGLAGEGARRAAALAPGSLWERRHAGAAALARGDAAGAVRILSELAPRDPGVEPSFLLAQALLAAGRPREALAPLARVTETYPLYAPRWQASLRGWGLLLRARALAALGEREAARAQLERLRRVWRRADPDLPLAGEARALAARLGTALAASPLAAAGR